MTNPARSWRKSSYSTNTGQCLELADAGAEILLRDSKHPEQGHFTFTRAEIAAFVAGVKAGELDDLA
jgi:DNA-binding sugar fermentation-stimulating protein